MCSGTWVTTCGGSASAPSVRAPRGWICGPLAWGDPLHETAHGDGLPRQGGSQLLADRLRAGRRGWATGILQHGGHHVLGGALVGAHGVESCDHSFRLRGPLLPLGQAHGRALGGRLHDRPPWAIGLPHPNGRGRRWGGRLGWPLIEGRHLPCRLHDRGFNRLEAQRQPQDALDDWLTRPVGLSSRPIDRPLPQEVGITAGRQAQLRVEGAEALLSRGREVMPRAAHLAKDRIVGRRTLIVRGQAHPVGSGDRLGRAYGRPRDQEQPSQRRA